MYNRTTRKVKCTDCGHRFKQTIEEGFFVRYDPNKCPECGSKHLTQDTSFIESLIELFK